jgi:chaperonin cofactor prefoldin
MDQEYGLEELVAFAQEIERRKETIEFQLEMYGGDDPAVTEIREQLESRLERLQEKEDSVAARIDALLEAADGAMP